MRITQPRRVILEELTKMKTHPTAVELFDVVRKRLPRVSLGTVYRNLDKLNSDDVILKLQFSDLPARFDARKDEHYHIRCVVCDRVDDVPVDQLSDIIQTFKNVREYRITGIRLELSGVCPECQKQQIVDAGSRKNSSMEE